MRLTKNVRQQKLDQNEGFEKTTHYSGKNWSYVAMVASVVVGTAAAAFVWWVFSVRIDAADTMTPEPEITQFGGTALLLVGLSVVVFVASAIFAGVRKNRLNRVK